MKHLFTIVLFFCVIGVKSQEKKTRILTGDISAQKSAGYARIYISSKTKNILGYTFADKKGHFVVEYQTDNDSVYLNISRIGYKTKIIKISSAIKHIKTELSISDKTEFKEIVVTADKKAIMERGDTIKYAVSAFADGTEVSAEDILAKLPGISVDTKTGKIKYQGKEIKKILLDGDDLTDNNYKVLSKNLAAEWLDEVEVLQHFTDSRLYHGIKQSEEVAINIKLKEDAKAPLFGSLEAGGGGWKKLDKYLSRAELLSYLKKLKIFAHAESSNTGIDVEAYNMESYMSSKMEYKGFISSSPYLKDQLYTPEFFKAEFFNFNRGHFLSNSMVFRPSKKTSVKSLTTLYNNNQNYDFSSRLEYLFPDQSISALSERQLQDQLELNLFQDLKIEHHISANQDINTRLQIKKNSNKLNTQNYSDSLNDINSLSNTDNLELFGSISYINKFADKWVSTTDFEIGTENFKEDFRFDSLKTEQTSTIGIQNTTQDYNNIGISSQLNGVFSKNWYTTFSLAWTRTGSEISAFTQDAAGNSNALPLNEYIINNLSGELLLNKKFKIFNFYLGSRIRSAYIAFNDVKNIKTFFEPTISFLVNKKIADLVNVKIKALYNIEYSFIKPYQLINTALFVNYRTINAFQTNAYTPIKNNINTASIEIRENRKSNITAHASWVYILSDNILTDDISYPSNMAYEQKIQGGSSSEFVSIYTLSKYFKIIKSSIKIAYNNDIINMPLVINDFPSTNTMNISSLSITSGTSLFKRKVNLSLAFNQNKTASKWNNEKNSLNYSRSFVKVRISLSKNISLATDYNMLYFNDLNYDVSILNSILKINTKKKKFSYIIKCNNILNTKAVGIVYLDPSLYSATIYPLQERMLIATIKYRF